MATAMATVLAAAARGDRGEERPQWRRGGGHGGIRHQRGAGADGESWMQGRGKGGHGEHHRRGGRWRRWSAMVTKRAQWRGRRGRRLGRGRWAGWVEIGDQRGRGRRWSEGSGGGARLGGPGSDGPWRWIRGQRWIAAAVRTGEERENQGWKNEGGDKMPCWPNEIRAEGSRGRHGSDHVARWGKDGGRWSSAKREEADGSAVTATKEAVDLW